MRVGLYEMLRSDPEALILTRLATRVDVVGAVMLWRFLGNHMYRLTPRGWELMERQQVATSWSPHRF